MIPDFADCSCAAAIAKDRLGAVPGVFRGVFREGARVHEHEHVFRKQVFAAEFFRGTGNVRGEGLFQFRKFRDALAEGSGRR